MAYCFPESEQEETEEIDGRPIELEEPFVCNENEGEEKCNERFVNYRQLKAHKTRKHGFRTVLGLLTRTNECPWCRSRFVDRETALNHVYNATETEGKCYINFSRWHHPLILLDDLQCRLCDHEAQDFEKFQSHGRSHHVGPNKFVKTSDECMESVQESDPRGGRRQRERQQVAQEWINESERQISSLSRRFARKVDRRAAKAEPQTRPGNQRARWGKASADQIHGARSGEAGNSDRVFWSVQGERGVLSGRNPSSAAQGECDDGV